MNSEHIDVLIVGAGISGIGTAYHLQANSPERTYTIVEARQELGGTWDLFRYPGIRSDSDMYTFGFNFKPWSSPKAISPGADIREYVKEAAIENDIYTNIQFSHKVVHASWSTEEKFWSVTVINIATDVKRIITCNFFFAASGYYRYDEGYTPEFIGRDDFKGEIIHPQKWPEELNYSGKKVIVIGSGATAVTLVPTLAETAEQVVMLQRSPTYIAALPAQDQFANFLRRYLPPKIAYSISRWKKILLGILMFNFAKRYPNKTKKMIMDGAKAYLGDDFDIYKHFAPSYKPWDQRICAVPDGDLFKSIRSGKAIVVTDHIDRFTENGIKLKSGEELTADIIVTATGLNAAIFHNMSFEVDGKNIEIGKTFCYKGMMLSGMPNFAFSMGYTNASWTLKSDLVGQYVSRLLNYMSERSFLQYTPTVPEQGIEVEPMMDFTSGYVLRSIDTMPKQGKHKPWRLRQNYILDRFSLSTGSINDSSIYFS
jgi:cation diffusion facilitator CzcD-associated flavoprotein CzcO